MTMPLSNIGLEADIDEIAFHNVELGRQLRFVCVSAEITWPHADMMKRAVSDKSVWPVGYIDAAFGYIPTQAMVAVGGYEVVGFQPLFGVKGEFHADAEESVRSLLLQEPGSELQQQVACNATGVRYAAR
jgi:hypothetical protein